LARFALFLATWHFGVIFYVTDSKIKPVYKTNRYHTQLTSHWYELSVWLFQGRFPVCSPNMWYKGKVSETVPGIL